MQDLFSRDRIIETVTAALAGEDSLRALWQAGSAANARADEWSDIDLIAVVRDEAVEQIFAQVEAALERECGIEILWKVPEPTWHGNSQRFYRLRRASPYHLLDLVVMKESVRERFLETRRHGIPIVCIDRDGIVRPAASDQAAWQERMAFRSRELAVTFPLFQPFVTKELRRGRNVDAYSFYFAFTIRPLVEMLRIKFCPDRFDFGLRYLTHDLPSELAQAVEALVYVGSAGELEQKQTTAVTLFNKYVNQTHG
jgi:predicted nucleotidyltransferase